MSGIIDKLDKILCVLKDHGLRISAIEQPKKELQDEINTLNRQVTCLNQAVFDNTNANCRDKSNLKVIELR